DTLRALFAGRLILIADGDTLRPRWTSIVPDPKRNGLRFAFEATLSRLPGALAIEARLFPYDRQHETYLNVHQDGALRLQDLLAGERRTATFYSGTRQGVAAVVGTFIRSGIHHIFIGPDHILFVVGLMLLGGGIGRLIKIVTAFTVAHSVTLALATLGILDPPARIIEPLIALSIVYVGVDTLRARRGGRDARALIAIGFGLIHGFGFAGVLREFGLPQQALGWSLFAFNLGVELGQATIVLLVAPVLSLARARAPSIHARIVTVGSWAVSLAGLYWLVERLFFAGP
ncbi:MAG TPA: HupE/UreJ family protein, partial [Candidatus Limnocylindria bacterium]|nr:HupE/UreJ family protein [Candidatus Limnocylindria bacterium]